MVASSNDTPNTHQEALTAPMPTRAQSSLPDPQHLAQVQDDIIRHMPQGTVTYLFTDMEDSTMLWQRHASLMGAAIQRHDALIEASVSAQHGVLVRPRGEGDSRFAVFSRPHEAVAAACDIQQRFAAELWPTPLVIRIRIGMHTGETELLTGDYYGTPVNLCARVRSLAHGGQTLLSRSTANLVERSVPAGAGLASCGSFQLKGLLDPVEVFQLNVPGLPNQFPPLSGQPAHQRPPFPRQLTSFVGRQDDIHALAQELAADQALVTLLGPGGIGKTRLALQTAAELIDTFSDGGAMADLSAARSAASVIDSIARGLDPELGYSVDQLKEHSERLDALCKWLRPRQLLLVLDNCEQVANDLGPIVDAVLKASAGLRILATSRVPLNIQAEQLFTVEPLAVPALPISGSLGDEQLARIGQFSAVALFVQRARKRKPEFTLTAENTPLVIEICQRLDRLPLAIELAAARSNVLTLKNIRDRLKNRLALLTSNARDVPERQQTLRAAIDWSYNLLSGDEQLLFERLGMLPGGATIAALEAICHIAAEPETARAFGEDQHHQPLRPLETEPLDLVTNLAEHSLITMAADTDGDARYSMFETIREYAQERATSHGEAEAIAARHAAYYFALAETAQPQLTGEQQKDWFGRLEDDAVNLEAALHWLMRLGDITRTLRMCTALWRFWYTQGRLNEGRKWLATAFQQAQPTIATIDAAARLEALNAAGGLAWAQGDFAEAHQFYEESLALGKTLNKPSATARALNNLGIVANAQADYSRAQHMYEEALPIFLELNDEPNIANTQSNLGVLAHDLGDDDKARQLHQQSLARRRKLGDTARVVISLINLGVVEQAQNNIQQARLHYREALPQARILADQESIAAALDGLARVAAEFGSTERAARLWAAASQLRKKINAPLPPHEQANYDRAISAARQQLGETAWAAAWAAGELLTVDEACSEALGV